jgi:hypothetical protein
MGMWSYEINDWLLAAQLSVTANVLCAGKLTAVEGDES